MRFINIRQTTALGPALASPPTIAPDRIRFVGTAHTCLKSITQSNVAERLRPEIGAAAVIHSFQVAEYEGTQ